MTLICIFSHSWMDASVSQSHSLFVYVCMCMCACTVIIARFVHFTSESFLDAIIIPSHGIFLLDGKQCTLFRTGTSTLVTDAFGGRKITLYLEDDAEMDRDESEWTEFPHVSCLCDTLDVGGGGLYRRGCRGNDLFLCQHCWLYSSDYDITDCRYQQTHVSGSTLYRK